MKNATILNRSISNISGDFRRNLPYILFTANVFLVIAFYFTMVGMHEDGLIYSSLAANMSHNVGSLWDPSFSEALWPHFFEHPPLAFYLQSIFIRFVGDNPNIDKLYFLYLPSTSS
jgi:4-amino-4-deoxy-L-arabinose transferase-like glycosyltransferase